MAAKDNPYPGVTFTSETIRHVNEQTFSADSSVAMAEEIATPGYSEQGNSGAFIVGAQVSPAPGVAKLNAPTDCQYGVQIQTGDRSASPALVNPNDAAFFAQLLLNYQITVEGLWMQSFPLEIPVSMPVPIIVMPHLTFVHDCSANVSEVASAVIFIELFYRTVKLDPIAYLSLVMQQQRQS